MITSIMYHDGNRRLQDAFDSRRISDRLEEKLTRTRFTPDDAAFIEGLPYFFLATADAAGRPDCSFKGGMPGFVRVTGPSELAFPDYDGNGMFKSLAISWSAPTSASCSSRCTASRNGCASTAGRSCAATPAAPGDRRRATDRPRHRPRDLPELPALHPEPAAGRAVGYAPRPGHEPPEPSWKGFAEFKDCIHPRQGTFKG
jgi:hypothetical protein